MLKEIEKTTQYEKILIAIFGTFLLVLTKFLFWQGDMALGYHSMDFRHFPNTS